MNKRGLNACKLEPCIIYIMAEFILEDVKLITDGIPTEKIPADMNLTTANRLKVATDPCFFKAWFSSWYSQKRSKLLQRTSALRNYKDGSRKLEHWGRSGRHTCTKKWILFILLQFIKNHKREGGCGPLGRPLNPPNRMNLCVQLMRSLFSPSFP